MNKQLPEQLEKVSFDLKRSLSIVLDCVKKGLPLKKKVRAHAPEFLAGVLETYTEYLEDNRVDFAEVRLDYNEITRELHVAVETNGRLEGIYSVMDIPLDIPGHELGFPLTRKSVPTVRVPV